MTQKEYKELNDYAITLIYTNPHLQACDVVNEVLACSIEAGESLDIKQLKRKIYSYVKKQLRTIRTVHTLVGYRPEETTRYCKSCNENKPIGGFYIFSRRSGTMDIFYRCKECHAAGMRKYSKTEKYQQRVNSKEYREKHNARTLKRYYKIKNTPEYKEHNKTRFRVYAEKNREKINTYVMQRDRHASENLTDNYIKKVLRYKVKTKDITPEMIIEKRQELLKKRGLKSCF